MWDFKNTYTIQVGYCIVCNLTALFLSGSVKLASPSLRIFKHFVSQDLLLG